MFIKYIFYSYFQPETIVIMLPELYLTYSKVLSLCYFKILTYKVFSVDENFEFSSDSLCLIRAHWHYFDCFRSD